MVFSLPSHLAPWAMKNTFTRRRWHRPSGLPLPSVELRFTYNPTVSTLTLPIFFDSFFVIDEIIWNNSSPRTESELPQSPKPTNDENSSNQPATPQPPFVLKFA
jgi:hypothetical protein